MKKIGLIIMLIISINMFSQQVSCNELINYVENNGTELSEVSTIQLLNSSWLNEVKQYKINDNYVVVAEIKKDNVGVLTKKYIFCGITKSDWEYFYDGLYDIGSTYGERFHKYILKKQCDCN